MSTTAIDHEARSRLRWWSVPRDVLVVSGPDATAYLQGQISQDVEAMVPGGSSWSFVLQPSGKVDVWFRVNRRDDDWVLDMDEGAGEVLAARLRRFLLRTDATVEARDWSMIAARGSGASAVAASGEVVADPEWPGVEGLDVIGPEPPAPPAAEPGEPDELEALRIEAGVPAMRAELDEDTIPAASGVVERSVSFTKGCYVGQELVARINSRGGSTPTRLCGVVAPAGPDLQVGADLEVDGLPAARVTSSARPSWRAGPIGLAYVKRAVELPAEATVPDSGPTVRLAELPLS